ncbi:MAG: hypothetical protein AAB250_10240, partial [Bdellovibrionota bacterium]
EDETVSLAPVRARLAELYSDRARLREMGEVQKSNQQTCQKTKTCGASVNDRRRALELYTRAETETPQEEKGALLIHMAHLHKLVNQPAKAEAIYDRLIKDGPSKHQSEFLAEAYVGRATRRYSRSEFSNALVDFEAGIKLAKKYKRGPIAHRIAWCNLNLDRQETAVVQLLAILQDPEMLKRDSTSGPTTDVTFQEEVATDLATFYARGTIKPGDAKRVADLAPQPARLRVVKYFAAEAERLGQKRAALEAWALANDLDPEGETSLENLVRVARVKYDLGDKPGTLETIQKSVALWKKRGCKANELECENLRKRLRNLVTDWNKGESLKPTENLLGAYVAYNSQFESDLQMNFFAAQIARELKKSTDAVAMYHKNSILAVKSAKSGDKEAAQILEASIAGEVEMAEAAPKEGELRAASIEMRQKAYDHYLRLAPKGTLAHSVRYQRARLPYEAGSHDEASSRLEGFAKSEDCRRLKAGKADSLCIQAADLDLDSRVVLKDDVAIEKGALSYARIFPERKIEYLKIARTSAQNQAKTMEPSRALAKLASIDTTGMDRDERLRLVKNRIALAERAQDLDQTSSAAKELLTIKGIEDKDYELAISRMAWVAEMKLDFKSAYQLNQKMDMSNLKPAERELRLAMFAELSGQNPQRHQENFIQLSKNSKERALVRAKLVRASRNPIRELRRHEHELVRFPAIFAPLAFEIFARTGDRGFAEKTLRIRSLRSQPAAKAMARQIFLADFMKLDQKVGSHKLRTRSDRSVQMSLTERLQLIGKAEQTAAKAIQSKDWTAQLVTLSVLSRENKRLHDEVLVLPVPRQLRGQDRLNYSKLVEQHANSFLFKHQAIEQKLAAFWKDSDAFTSLVDDYESATRPELRRALARELRVIAHVAPESRKERLERALKTDVDIPSSTEVATVVKAVKDKPFSPNKIEKLRELESSRGRETMVAYLDARLTRLKGEVKQ